MSSAKEALRTAGIGVGRDGDKIVGLSTVLAAGIQQHYGIDVPLFEVILPAGALVALLARRLANFCNSLE